MSEYYIVSDNEIIGLFKSLTNYPNSRGELFGFNMITDTSLFIKIDQIKLIDDVLKLNHEDIVNKLS